MSLPTSLEELLAEVKALSAEDKVALFKGLGMSRIGDNHHPDCLARNDSGMRDNCVPDPATWTSPKDVTEFFGETWEQRLAAAQERDRRREEKERLYNRV